MPLGRCHPSMPTGKGGPILASVVYTCEALAGIWGSASAPAVRRTAGALADLLIMGGAQSENKLQKISVK